MTQGDKALTSSEKTDFTAVMTLYDFYQVWKDLIQFDDFGFFYQSVPPWVTDVLSAANAIENQKGTRYVMSVEEAVHVGWRYVAMTAMGKLQNLGLVV